MKHHPLVAALAALAFAVTGCANDGSPSGAQPSRTAEPNTEATVASADWLAGQLTGGLTHNEQYDFDDIGLSIDVALGLAAVGGHDSEVDQVAGGVAAKLDGYVAPGYGTLASSGGLAKALVLAQTAGQDPTAFGGHDLVGELEGTIADHGPAAGRGEDALDPKEKSAADYSNTVSQSYVVWGLGDADSPEAGPATAYLLQQQCSAGFFRLSLTPDPTAEDQSCDGDPKAKPDVDATALAARVLAASDDPDARAAADEAVAWLTDQQAEDGALGAPQPNSNSTGLAGWAMGEHGDADVAGLAAQWVAAHEVCDGPDAGAIAYDDASLGKAQGRAIGVKAQDQFRRATAQALPALLWLVPNGGSC